MFRLMHILFLALLALMGACTPSATPAISLPLAADRPTFFFFYTDN